MSDDDTADEREYETYETDWLATSVYGYGYGYTAEQALESMARYSSPEGEGTTHVALIEHVGHATTGMTGARVDNLVTLEEYEIDNSDLREARDAAIDANVAVERALENAERVDTEE